LEGCRPSVTRGIRFVQPARQTLYATFRVAPDELDRLRVAVDVDGSAEREFAVELTSATGETHATCQKLLYVRRRPASRTQG